MKHANKTVGAGILLGLLALASGMPRPSETPMQDPADLLLQVATLQESLSDLESSGDLSQKDAKSLGKKLEKVAKALESATEPASSDDIDAQLVVDPLVQGLSQAIDALLVFIGELSSLVTALPPDVIQPIIDGAIELLRDLFGFLLG